ncbi:hypothetical protein V8E55_005812 [Tylopilus felleus]
MIAVRAFETAGGLVPSLLHLQFHPTGTSQVASTSRPVNHARVKSVVPALTPAHALASSCLRHLDQLVLPSVRTACPHHRCSVTCPRPTGGAQLEMQLVSRAPAGLSRRSSALCARVVRVPSEHRQPRPASFTHWPSDREGPSFRRGETSWSALRAHVVCVPFDVARWACIELLKSPFGLGRLLRSSLAARWSAGCFRAASDSDSIVRAVPGRPAMKSVRVSEWPTTPLVQVGTAFVAVAWLLPSHVRFDRSRRSSGLVDRPLESVRVSEWRPIIALSWARRSCGGVDDPGFSEVPRAGTDLRFYAPPR